MPTVKEKLLFASALSLAIASTSISAQPAIVPTMPLCTDASQYSSGTCITPLPPRCTDPSQYDSGKCIRPYIPGPRDDPSAGNSATAPCRSCGSNKAAITINADGVKNCRGRGCSFLTKQDNKEANPEIKPQTTCHRFIIHPPFQPGYTHEVFCGIDSRKQCDNAAQKYVNKTECVLTDSNSQTKTPEPNNIDKKIAYRCFSRWTMGSPGSTPMEWEFYCGNDASETCWRVAKAKNQDSNTGSGMSMGMPVHYCRERQRNP